MASQRQAEFDAIVVGAGPNGLAAAITIAQEGRKVLVVEANDAPGGGARTESLTLPGFHHDTCSAIHPLGVSSPFFRSLPLEQYGVRWVFSPAALAHPFDDGHAVLLEKSLQATAQGLGADGRAYTRLMAPLANNWTSLSETILKPIRFPRHPFLMLRFGLRAMHSARSLSRSRFKTEYGRGFFAGMAAHAMVPLEFPFTATYGLVLAAAGHGAGWPLLEGGSGRLTDALVAHFHSLGGTLLTGQRVADLEELPRAHTILMDLTPRQILPLLGKRLPDSFRRKMERFRYGPGVYKVDWALDAPIPWSSPSCARAATVHLGPTLDDMCASERAAWDGSNVERPYIIVGQQSLFDPSRAPEGKHTAWAYCHVPNGSTEDRTGVIEAQMERFAPGFGDRILARHSLSPADLERHNANLIGGDIGGGANDAWQLFGRPAFKRDPYALPVPGHFLCSSSTPPGGGVHGMSGYNAARSALKYLQRLPARARITAGSAAEPRILPAP